MTLRSAGETSNGTLDRSVIVHPGTAHAFVPALIVWWTRDTPAAASLACTSSIPFRLGLAAFRV